MMSLPRYAVALFLVIVPVVHGVSELKDHEIYKLRNRHDLAFLTGINVKTSDPPVVLDGWRDAGTQKWRAIKSYTANLYSFIPTSDDARILSLDSKKENLVAQAPQATIKIFGLANKQYWEVKNVGSGYSQLKNYKSGECLTGLGNKNQVGVTPCENNFRQQWEIVQV